jgi:hypothetical protein
MKKVDVIIKKEDVILVKNTNTTWYKRLWNLISNPFRYLFTGTLQY